MRMTRLVTGSFCSKSIASHVVLRELCGLGFLDIRITDKVDGERAHESPVLFALKKKAASA
jgi:hypothetical protein